MVVAFPWSHSMFQYFSKMKILWLWCHANVSYSISTDILGFMTNWVFSIFGQTLCHYSSKTCSAHKLVKTAVNATVSGLFLWTSSIFLKISILFIWNRCKKVMKRHLTTVRYDFFLIRMEFSFLFNFFLFCNRNVGWIDELGKNVSTLLIFVFKDAAVIMLLYLQESAETTSHGEKKISVSQYDFTVFR